MSINFFFTQLSLIKDLVVQLVDQNQFLLGAFCCPFCDEQDFISFDPEEYDKMKKVN